MNVAIGLGLAEFPFATAQGYWRWVDLCEQGGVDSLWQTDRLIGRRPFLEPLAAMAALAGRTRRLRFGMNVVSMAFRDPVLLAKQCATIDVLSEGRLLPAFGIGSPAAPEWAALGIGTDARGRRTDEGLEILRRLWTEESVDFDGSFHRLRGASIAPRPVQPELPMWIGGSSPAAVRRTARFGTGWQAGGDTPAETGRMVAAIKRAAAEAGRAIDPGHYGAGFAFWFGAADDSDVAAEMARHEQRTGRPAAQAFVVGDAEAVLRRVADYVAVGVSKFILRPAGRDDETVMRQTRHLIDRVLPEVELRWPRRAAQVA